MDSKTVNRIVSKQRIPDLQAREPGKIPVGGQKFIDSMAETDGGDAGIVNSGP
jgi:hypothetical protein